MQQAEAEGGGLMPEGIEKVRHGVATGWPFVAGKCPACGSSSLFLGSGGYVTCLMLRCPDPSAASEALGVEFPKAVGS